jgi:cell fate regulator YaaT (PSP1 superfamily)
VREQKGASAFKRCLIDMADTVGIRFKRATQVYYFDPSDIPLEVGDKVVVETTRGPSIGTVVIPPKGVDSEESAEPLKPVLRRAEPEDLEQALEMKQKEKEARDKCAELVAKYNLPMTPLAAESSLDGNYITIHFKSEKRVDFRALLREMSSSLRTRVELRQVGARDAARLVGGMGRCGCGLCCANHLCKFEPISMRMAREQDLPLNPANISGVCGRLLCCLAYESEQYRAMKKQMPTPGKNVNTSAGRAKVLGCNPLKGTVKVRLESDATVELPLSEIEWPGDKRPN